MASGFAWLLGCEFGPLGVIKVPFITACKDGDDAAEGLCFLKGGEKVDCKQDARRNGQDVYDW